MVKWVVILLLGSYIAAWWWHMEVVVRPNPNSGKVASERIKAAVWKMGPKKDYRILEDGTLQVKVEGEWLRLRY